MKWQRVETHRPKCPESGKVCLEKKAAETIINKVRESKRDKVPIRLYKCYHCNWYHVSSKEKDELNTSEPGELKLQDKWREYMDNQKTQDNE